MIVFPLYFSIRFWRDDHQRIHAAHCFNNIIRVIAFVRQYSIGMQSAQQCQCLLAVGGLSACQEEAQRIAKRITYCMYFGGEASA